MSLSLLQKMKNKHASWPKTETLNSRNDIFSGGIESKQEILAWSKWIPWFGKRNHLQSFLQMWIKISFYFSISKLAVSHIFLVREIPFHDEL